VASRAMTVRIHLQTALHRHCERSEAIHRAARKKVGLLRFARNDGKTQLRDLAARYARGLPEISLNPPIRGAGNAGRTMHPQPRVGN
jgi:hypothetical protein